MFQSFSRDREQPAHRRYALSTVLSAATFGSILCCAAWVTGASRPSVLEDKVEVLFRPPPEAPPPPPPPPPPSIPVAMRVRQPGPALVTPAAPPPPELIAPQAVSPERHPETAPDRKPVPVVATEPSGSRAGGKGQGSGAGSGTGTGSGDGEGTAEEAAVAAPPPKPDRSVPIHLPEEAEAPEPDEGNENPECPESVRTEGVAATAIFKIVINQKGDVSRADLLRGDAAFAPAALAAVQRWHYTPALLDGAPITVFKIVKITCTP
jgi:protein TonB